MNVTQSLMPDAKAAAERALPPETASLMPPMPAPIPAQGPPPPAAPQMSLPPGIEMPPQAQPVGNTMQQQPEMPHIKPPPIPFDAMVQDDGSIAAVVKGTKIFLQRYEPPKMPPALQPPKPPKSAAQPTQQQNAPIR